MVQVLSEAMDHAPSIVTGQTPSAAKDQIPYMLQVSLKPIHSYGWAQDPYQVMNEDPCQSYRLGPTHSYKSRPRLSKVRPQE